MSPPFQCHQCAAPLPPAAQKCQFCGAVTAWGATLAAQQHQAAQASSDRERQAALAKARSGVRTGLILSIVGLPICCAPLSLVGGVMAYRAGSQVKAAGQPRPATSVIALVLAALSVVALTTVSVLYYRDQQQRTDQLAGVGARLQGKRENLDPKVACDLTEEHLVDKGYGEKHYNLENLHCDGALAVADRRATLPDVRFSLGGTAFTATACLEKRSRWFIVEMREGQSCADLPPPAAFTPPPRQLSEEELKADEEKARADLKKAARAGVVQAFTGKLAKVRAHAATPGPEKPCPKGSLSRYLAGGAGDRREVPYVDFDFFDWKGGDDLGKAWAFLTSAELKRILDPKRGPEERAKDIEDLRTKSGPLLAVFKADAKLLPAVTSAKGFDGGAFAGSLLVYDIDSGDRVCQTSLTFESSDLVSFRKGRFSSDKTKLADAILGDFQSRFETAATDAVTRAAPDLRLGLKVLE